MLKQSKQRHSFSSIWLNYKTSCLINQSLRYTSFLFELYQNIRKCFLRSAYFIHVCSLLTHDIRVCLYGNCVLINKILHVYSYFQEIAFEQFLYLKRAKYLNSQTFINIYPVAAWSLYWNTSTIIVWQND